MRIGRRLQRSWEVLDEITSRLRYSEDHPDRGRALLNLHDPDSRPENLFDIIAEMSLKYPDYLGIRGGCLLSWMQDEEKYTTTKEFGNPMFSKVGKKRGRNTLPLVELSSLQAQLSNSKTQNPPVLYRYNTKVLRRGTYIGLGDYLEHIVVLEQKRWLWRRWEAGSIIRHIASLTSATMKAAEKYQAQKEGKIRAQDVLRPTILAISAFNQTSFRPGSCDYLDISYFARPVFSIDDMGVRIGGDHLILRQSEYGVHVALVDLFAHGKSPAPYTPIIRICLMALTKYDPAIPINRLVGITDEVYQELIANVNEELRKNPSWEDGVGSIPEQGTYFCSQISKEGLVRYCIAGHHPPLLLDSNGTFLEGTFETDSGQIIGLSAEHTYKEGEFTLGIGDVMIPYTDGLVDAMNQEGEHYGIDRLKEVLYQHRGSSSTRIKREVISSVYGFCGKTEGMFDDITMAVVKRTK